MSISCQITTRPSLFLSRSVILFSFPQLSFPFMQGLGLAFESSKTNTAMEFVFGRESVMTVAHDLWQETWRLQSKVHQILPVPISKDTTTRAARRVQKKTVRFADQVLHIHQCPSWMQDDQLISMGYRLQQDSYIGCLASLFYAHNETVSTWSHLIMGCFFLSLSIWGLWFTYAYDHGYLLADLLAFQTYLVGATLCLMFSVCQAQCFVLLQVMSYSW